MVYVVMHRKGHRSISTVNARTAGIDEVFNAMAPASFDDVSEAYDVAVNVGKWVFDGIPNAGLGGKIDHPIGLVGGKSIFHYLSISEVDSQVGVVRVVFVSR